MPYFRFTLIYEGGFAARLVPGRRNPIVEPRIRDIFLSDLRALNVKIPTTNDQIRIYEAGSISLDFAYDPNGNGLGYGQYLTVESTQNTDARLLAIKKTRSIHRIELSQTSFMGSSIVPFVDTTFNVNNRSEPKPVPPSTSKKRPLSATEVTKSKSQNNFKRIRLSNGMTAAQFKDSRLNSIDNTLKSLSLIKAEPSSPSTLLATLLSSHEAAPISKEHAQVPNIQYSAIASQSITHFPKLEPTETSVPALLKRMDRAHTPRGPRSNQQKRPVTYTRQRDSPGMTGSTIRKRPRTHGRQPTSPDPTQKLNTTQIINHYTRELWDTRREISAAQARESALEKNIRSLDPGGGGVPEPAGDILESKAARARRLDMENRLQAAKAALDVERKKREVAEKCLADVERECRAPFVVPALLQTFMKISQLSKGCAQKSTK